jgi:TM2 domain-containing membrane protein YozV
MELQRVAAFSPSDAARREAGMLMGVCHAFRGRWEEARRAYGAAPRGDNGALRDLVEARLAPGRMPRVRSPVAAAWLSTFIPGAGQMYAGDWKDGFNALGLNALTAFLLVEGVLDGRYGDVMFVHLAFFERFYFGNRDNARLAVEARNRRVNRTVAVRLMEDVARSVAAQSE